MHGLWYGYILTFIAVSKTNWAIEPAHAQVAENRIAYILSKLIKDGAFSDNEALLDYSYELIELAAEQGMALSLSAYVPFLTRMVYRTRG